MTTASKAVCGGEGDLQRALTKLYRHALNCPGAEYDGDAIESANRVLSAALASTAGAGAWRPMNTAPSDTPIVARHKPNSRTPHGWVATISRAPEDPDERVGGLDTILHYNGNALMCGFHGVWVGWMYPEEFAALALSAGTLSVGWDGARDAFARIVEDRAWTAEHGEPRAACLRAAADIRQAKAPAVPASARSGAGEEEEDTLRLLRVLEQELGTSGTTETFRRALAVAKEAAARAHAELASPPAPAEHGVEIREDAPARPWQFECTPENGPRILDALGAEIIGPNHGNGDAMVLAVKAVNTALSQGGGAGRSERAVEIRELATKLCAIVYDLIACPIPARALSPAWLAAADKAEAELRKALHRSEIAGRSEKGEGEEEGRASEPVTAAELAVVDRVEDGLRACSDSVRYAIRKEASDIVGLRRPRDRALEYDIMSALLRRHRQASKEAAR